jgi:hypothetical protein
VVGGDEGRRDPSSSHDERDEDEAILIALGLVVSSRPLAAEPKETGKNKVSDQAVRGARV